MRPACSPLKLSTHARTHDKEHPRSVASSSLLLTPHAAQASSHSSAQGATGVQQSILLSTHKPALAGTLSCTPASHPTLPFFPTFPDQSINPTVLIQVSLSGPIPKKSVRLPVAAAPPSATAE
jgi:hypothetical protein